MQYQPSDFSETVPLTVHPAKTDPDPDAPHTAYRRVDRLLDAAAAAIVVLLAAAIALPTAHAALVCAALAVLIHLTVPNAVERTERRLALEALERRHHVTFLHVGFDGAAEWERDGDVRHGTVRYREGRAWLLDDAGYLL